MFNSTVSPQYEYVQYIVLDNVVKNQKKAYNTCNRNIGDNMPKKYDEDVFVPTNEDMKAAQKRLQERIKQGTTKGYNKYLKNLIKSFADIRNDG